MPYYPHPDWEDIQKHIYIKGTITSVDFENDTADVTVPGGEDGEDIPIFYHCEPESEERDNGAIEGAAAGFGVDDEVIVMCTVAGEPVRIVAHVDGIKACDLYLYVKSSQTNYCVVWNMGKEEPATGIIGTSGDEITEWPVPYSELWPWVSKSTIVSHDDLFRLEATAGFTHATDFDCVHVAGEYCAWDATNSTNTCKRESVLFPDSAVIDTTIVKSFFVCVRIPHPDGEGYIHVYWSSLTLTRDYDVYTGSLYTALNESEESINLALDCSFDSTSGVSQFGPTPSTFTSTLNLLSENPYISDPATVINSLPSASLFEENPILYGGFSDTAIFQIFIKLRLEHLISEQAEEGSGVGDKFLVFASAQNGGDLEVEPTTIPEQPDLSSLIQEAINKDTPSGETPGTATLLVQIRK